MLFRRCMLLGCLLVLGLFGSGAMAVEEPPFTTVLQDGDFEVRDYPALVVAEVTVTGAQKEAASKGFRLLAGYIFGGNQRRQDIAMTAPVGQQPASEKIAMTAPVTQVADADRWIVRFTMPSTYTLDTLPRPDSPLVQLKQLPPQRVAVLRFAGLAAKDDVDAKIADLVAVTTARHLRIVGPATLAQYSPPWTLWFMRRNEVMKPVEAQP